MWKWHGHNLQRVLGNIVSLFVLPEKLPFFFVLAFSTLLRTKELNEISISQILLCKHLRWPTGPTAQVPNGWEQKWTFWPAAFQCAEKCSSITSERVWKLPESFFNFFFLHFDIIEKKNLNIGHLRGNQQEVANSYIKWKDFWQNLHE